MKKILISNWKMYMDVRGGIALAREMVRLCRGKETLPDLVVCPPALALLDVQKTLAHTRIHLGAQNVFWNDEGAHTGELGPKMLVDAGCSYVIVGHSERRRDLGETSLMITEKVSAALTAGLFVVLCIGEDAQDRHDGKTMDVIRAQVREAIKGLHGRSLEKLLIAYEPLWAITGVGSTSSAPVEDVVEVCTHLREELTSLAGVQGQTVPLLYGGSVTGENAYTYLREDTVNGLLVGSASVKIHQWSDIFQAALRSLRSSSV